MHSVLLAMSIVLLSGCGKWERVITGWTGDLTTKCSPQGVEYLQSDSGLALSVDRDGKPIRCGMEGDK